MIDKFEVGELVRTLKGLGTVELVKKVDEGYHYLVKLEGDRGSYFFTDEQVFPYI